MALDRIMRRLAVLLAASAVASGAVAGIKPPPAAQPAQADGSKPAKVSPYAKANRERAKAPKAAHKGPTPLSARWTPATTNRGGRH